MSAGTAKNTRLKTGQMKRKIFLLAGLGYGDEGKGTTVDWLSANYPVKSIWRYNGGAQAAHHVVSEAGESHCFSQLGSGLLTKPITTYLSKFMVINPISLRAEYEELRTKIGFPIPEIYLDPQALVITPYHVLINQMREVSRGEKRIGSCGRGVGETMKDARNYSQEIIRVQDLSNPTTLKYKLRFWRTLKIDAAEQLIGSDANSEGIPLRLALNLEKMRSEDYFQDLLAWYDDFAKWSGVKMMASSMELSAKLDSDSDIIFEGAQGALLDRDHGFYPHVTQSDTSFRNAERLLQENEIMGEVIKIGILRAYSTRHGAGPFVTYDSELANLIPEQNNTTNDWQGDFRVGWLDLVATRYALKILGEINGIALTNLDRLLSIKKIKTCNAYEYRGSKSREEVAKFFDLEPGSAGKQSPLVITGIKLLASPELSDYYLRQEMTNILNDCQPIYQTHKVDSTKFVRNYVKHLEQILGTKVLLTSTGPKASEKKITTPLLK